MKLNDTDLSIKQRKWIAAYIKTGNATEAAMQAYDCKNRNSAAQIGHENLQKLDFADLLEEMKLTRIVFANVLAEGLTKSIKVDINGDKHPDYSTRHKYLETGLKMLGLGNDDTKPVLPEVNITITRGEENEH